jgi:hypothetical protein
MHRGLCLFVLVGVVGSLELREYPFLILPQFEIYIKQCPEIKRVVLSEAFSCKWISLRLQQKALFPSQLSGRPAQLHMYNFQPGSLSRVRRRCW